MKLILSVVIVLGLIGAGIFLYSSAQKPASLEATSSSGVSIQENNTSVESPTNSGSRYVQYSKTKLDNSKNTRRVLFFYANWCPTCRPADTSFSQNESKIPSDVTVIRVNYRDTETDQEEKDLAAKYVVTYQHTYVQIDENGKEVTKWNGGQITELLQNIK